MNISVPGVYSITSKTNSKVYIGSSKSVHQRWAEHKSCLRHNRHHNNHLQAHVNKYGLGDLVFEVMEVEPDEALRTGLEQLLVTALYGPNCFNQGRDVLAPALGRVVSPETRAKLSKINKGRKASPETRALLSAAGKGRKQSPESIEKTRQASLGRVKSPETRAKISAAKTGKSHPPHTEETKAKMSAAAAGRTVSAEVRSKISSTNRGRIKSTEARLNMSLARKGVPWTPAQRASFNAKKGGR